MRGEEYQRRYSRKTERWMICQDCEREGFLISISCSILYVKWGFELVQSPQFVYLKYGFSVNAQCHGFGDFYAVDRC